MNLPRLTAGRPDLPVPASRGTTLRASAKFHTLSSVTSRRTRGAGDRTPTR